MPMDLQMARAKGSFAVPEKTFTGKNFLVKKENPPDAADESRQNRNSRPAPRKLNLKERFRWSAS
jgi:hypothetical protein